MQPNFMLTQNEHYILSVWYHHLYHTITIEKYENNFDIKQYQY